MPKNFIFDDNLCDGNETIWLTYNFAKLSQLFEYPDSIGNWPL